MCTFTGHDWSADAPRDVSLIESAHGGRDIAEDTEGHPLDSESRLRAAAGNQGSDSLDDLLVLLDRRQDLFHYLKPSVDLGKGRRKGVAQRLERNHSLLAFCPETAGHGS